MRPLATAISDKNPGSATPTGCHGTRPLRTQFPWPLQPLLLCSPQLGADPGIALPKPSLPVRLALLVAGTTLPLILFAAGIVFNNYEQDRRNATQRVLDTVRSIRLVLDSEMQRMTGALQVLSLTNTLRDRDFEGFRRISQAFLDQYGEGGVVLVADREGRQVFSSVTTD